MPLCPFVSHRPVTLLPQRQEIKPLDYGFPVCKYAVYWMDIARSNIEIKLLHASQLMGDNLGRL